MCVNSGPTTCDCIDSQCNCEPPKHVHKHVHKPVYKYEPDTCQRCKWLVRNVVGERIATQEVLTINDDNYPAILGPSGYRLEERYNPYFYDDLDS